MGTSPWGIERYTLTPWLDRTGSRASSFSMISLPCEYNRRTFQSLLEDMVAPGW